MARTFEDARSWAHVGGELFVKAADLDAAALDAPSMLPEWTRRHVVAHVAANADALGNLVHWAATGERTPMYSSPEERAEGIARGARLPAAELLGWLRESAEQLGAAMDALDDAQWRAEVLTAQGRTVPATELPWMRAREVCVHAVDLGTGTGFADLPVEFLAALCADVVGKRSASHAGPALELSASDAEVRCSLPGEGETVQLTTEIAELTAYLTGRPHGVRTADGAPAPSLGPWL